MAVQLAATQLAGRKSSPALLVVVPGLGTTVDSLWQVCARLVRGAEVLGVDLPGHGHSAPADHPFTVPDLAEAVAEVAVAESAGRPVVVAGVSLGGAVAMELAIQAPPWLSAVALIATVPKFGEPALWHERADIVRKAGTPVIVSGAGSRWFAPGFVARDSQVASRMLLALSETDKQSYARCCEALADFDRSEDLHRLTVPAHFAPGELDPVVRPADAAGAAADAPGSTLAVIGGCSHQPPAEQPQAVADLLQGILLSVAHQPDPAQTTSDDALTSLDPRARHAVALTALLAVADWEGFAKQVSAADADGLSPQEIRDVIAQAAVFCGDTLAEQAQRIASEVLRRQE